MRMYHIAQGILLNTPWWPEWGGSPQKRDISICTRAIIVICFFLNLGHCSYFTWRRQWHPTPVLLPGKSYGQRSLVGFSPWGRWESYTIEWLHFHFSLSCIGEGNGNPLQRSCLENPRDRGAWWAAVYGVAQSRTRLKWLSSSSSRFLCPWNSPGKNTI